MYWKMQVASITHVQFIVPHPSILSIVCGRAQACSQIRVYTCSYATASARWRRIDTETCMTQKHEL